MSKLNIINVPFGHVDWKNPKGPVLKRVLHLTLKKKWFDMILSGEKKHEYREDKKFWRTRLVIPNTHPPICKEFDLVCFKNGYSPNSPQMTLECEGVRLGWGKPEWGGDPNNLQFVIKLGKIVSDKLPFHFKHKS